MGLSPITRADEALLAVYQRTRDITSFFPANGRLTGGHWGAVDPGFYNPWFAPQAFVGTWYERPYPHHFDYYRWRSNTAAAPMPTLDCPCAEAIEERSISP
jgi:hypothetical protein